MSERMRQTIRFRYRGILVIVRHYDNGQVVATGINTGGIVHYFEYYWSIVMMEYITDQIDRYISDKFMDDILSPGLI